MPEYDSPTTGMVHPFNLPRSATAFEKRIRAAPEHSIPFFWHFLQVGCVSSHMIRRLEHWKHPV
jgi:hypothetical protein